MTHFFWLSLKVGSKRLTKEKIKAITKKLPANVKDLLILSLTYEMLIIDDEKETSPLISQYKIREFY